MTTVITQGSSTITPTIMLGYQAAQTAGTIVHPILGRANPDVTLRVSSLRVGRLQLGFSSATSAADSKAAADLLCNAAVSTLADTDQPGVAMSFVVANGTVTRELEDETRAAWVVSFDFTEVSL